MSLFAVQARPVQNMKHLHHARGIHPYLGNTLGNMKGGFRADGTNPKMCFLLHRGPYRPPSALKPLQLKEASTRTLTAKPRSDMRLEPCRFNAGHEELRRCQTYVPRDGGHVYKAHDGDVIHLMKPLYMAVGEHQDTLVDLAT